MKKLLALLLAVATLFCIASCSKKDEDDETLDAFKREDVVYTQTTLENGDVLYFESIDSETVAIVGFSGKKTPHEIVIPKEVQTSDDKEAGIKTVTKIETCAFYAVSALEKITLPETLTEIGDYAFAKCAQLKNINFTNNTALKTIGQGAFKDCVALTSITFSATSALTALPAYVFSGCTALTAVTVPGYIETVGAGAFYGCTSITTVVLSEGVKNVEKQAFQNTTALAALTLPSTFANEPNPLEDLAFAGSEVLTRANITCLGAAAVAYADEMILAE